MSHPHTPAPLFPATRWTIVLAAAGTGESARLALDELCRLYWFPLYAFSRQWGCSAEDAEDETQNFLIKMASADLLSRAGPDCGRLRTYLLKAFQRDLIDAHRRAHRRKRGGAAEFVPLEAVDAESVYRQTSLLSSAAATYDQLWAMTCLDSAVRTIETEYTARGRAVLFAALRPFLDPGGDHDYEVAAAATGLDPNAVRQAVFRLRQRFRTVLRQTVADTLHHPSEAMIEEELAALRAALSGHSEPHACSFCIR